MGVGGWHFFSAPRRDGEVAFWNFVREESVTGGVRDGGRDGTQSGQAGASRRRRSLTPNPFYR